MLLRSGAKLTSVKGIIFSAGKYTINVVVSDAFGAEGKTSVPAVTGGAPGTVLTIVKSVEPISADAAEGLLGGALNSAKGGDSAAALGNIAALFSSLNSGPGDGGAPAVF